MKEPEKRDVEKYLRSFTLRPAPQGLRARILGAAAATEKSDRVLTPFLRKCLAGCAAVLIIIFAADTLVFRLESGRIEAFGGKRPPGMTETESELSTLAEFIGVPAAYLQAAPRRTIPADLTAIRKASSARFFNPDKISFPEEEF